MKLFSKLSGMNSNNKIIIKNTFFSFLIKGGSLVLSLLTTPAFIKYFDNNTVLGVWYTLLSVLTWFLTFDLGIGNGIRNNLVKELAEKDYQSAKKTISSGLFSVGIVTVILSVIGITLISIIDLRWVFNISESLISYKAIMLSTIFVFIAIMLRFMLTTVSSVFYAMQQSAVNNFLSLCISILLFLFVFFVRFRTLEQSLIFLSLAYIAISNLPIIIAAIIVFSTKLKACAPSVKAIDKKHIKAVMGIGSVFFVCQILYMLITNTNELLVTKLFSPEYTTEYTFYYKITSLIYMVIVLAMTPIWSVVTKAMAEKKYDWLNKLYKKIKLFGLLAIALQFMLVPFMQIIMDIWLREDSIDVNFLTAVAFACFGSAFIYSGMLSTIVCGMARMKLQAIVYALGVLIKFALVLGLYKIVNDWSIVVWSNTIILLPYCIIQQIDLDRYFKKLLVKEIS